MSYDPLIQNPLLRYMEMQRQKEQAPKEQPKYLPSFVTNPTQFINPAYTQVSMDGGLDPLQQFVAFKQTGMKPQDQNTFTPWSQPATPMVEVFTPPTQSKPGFLGTSGAK